MEKLPDFCSLFFFQLAMRYLRTLLPHGEKYTWCSELPRTGRRELFFFFFKEWNVSYCVVDSQARSLHTWCASWISFGVIVNTFGMDSAQVVLKKANQIGLTCFLQSTSCCTLEVQICLKPRAVSHTRLWKGSLRIRSCADFW